MKMIRIVTSIVLLVLLAILVSLNFGYTTPINIFGMRIIDSIPVVAVSALSFAFGILYSLFIYVGSTMRQKSKLALKAQGRKFKLWEKDRAADTAKAK
jgi:uncharacterized integral membrane protein